MAVEATREDRAEVFRVVVTQEVGGEVLTWYVGPFATERAAKAGATRALRQFFNIRSRVIQRAVLNWGGA